MQKLIRLTDYTACNNCDIFKLINEIWEGIIEDQEKEWKK